MTRGTGLRQYRACVRCRARKSRCDFGGNGKPPCAKCHREGVADECTPAASRRGGDFSRLRRRKNKPSPQPRTHEPTVAAESSLSSPPPCQRSRLQSHAPTVNRHHNDTIHGDSLQNPSDALLILANTCAQQHSEENDAVARSGSAMDANAENVLTDGDVEPMYSQAEHVIPTPLMTASLPSEGSSLPFAVNNFAPGNGAIISPYPPLRDGILDVALLGHLLQHYVDNYHAFFPIVPRNLLQPSAILENAKREAFLLTAVLSVASRDRADLVGLHDSMWKYMRDLILGLVIGTSPGSRSVGCVEGLLLLGEWTRVDDSHAGEGATWSIIGLAVRLAYLLRLEDSSFRAPGSHGNDPGGLVTQRKRLAWTFTYLSDRQISIRMGQAFWCRGPSLSTRFTAKDFPSLQPLHSYDEDLASFLQAQIELTTLFGNAHDILFASKQRTKELMERGDYSTYIDDTRRSLMAWRRTWDNLAVSCHLKSCLELMQHYLRLYVTAFAFQAALYRCSIAGEDYNGCFPDSIMASPDARHIYEAVEAAGSLLKIAVDDINPEKHLRYMPARFYLHVNSFFSSPNSPSFLSLLIPSSRNALTNKLASYEMHSAVFLYKAHTSGALSSGTHAESTALMRRFIAVLRTAAGTDSDHVASKYAGLLWGLWFEHPAAKATSTTAASRVSHDSNNTRVNSRPRNTLLAPEVPVRTGNAQSDHQLTPRLDDMGFSQLDYSDFFDSWFQMSTVFPWDQPFL